MTAFPTNPFHGDVDVPGLDPAQTDAFVADQREIDTLIDRLTESSNPGQRGRIVLLKAPRAGCGKTALLRALEDATGERASFLPLPLDCDKPPGWVHLHHDILDQFTGRPAGATPCPLDTSVRLLLAHATAGLIERRQVPTSDPAAALRNLDECPLEILAFSEDGKEPAFCRWFRACYAELHPLLVRQLSAETGLPETATSDWLHLLCHFTTSACHAAREKARQALHLHVSGRQDNAASPATTTGAADNQARIKGSRESLARDRLATLCTLLAAPRPLVIALDGLDGFFNRPDAGRVVARLVSELQSASRRTSILLAVNEDLWQSTFDRHLPGALEDRLTTDILTHGGIPLRAARQLLRSRMQRAEINEQTIIDFLHFLPLHERPGGEQLVAPRQVLRLAARRWPVFLSRRETGESAGDPRASHETFARGKTRERIDPGAQPLHEDFLPEIASPGSPPAIFDDSLRGLITTAASQLVSEEHSQDGGTPAETSASATIPASTAATAGTAAAPGEEGDAPPDAAPSLLDYFAAEPHPLMPGDEVMQPDELPAEAPAADTARDDSERGRTPFARIRQMLQQLREAREQPAADGAAGARDEAQASPGAPSLAGSNGNAEDIRAIFERACDTLKPDPSEELHQDRMARLIRNAGAVLPDIHPDEFMLTDDDSRTIASWGYFNRETLFGFAPLDDKPCWQSLSSFVANRAGLRNSPGRSSRNPDTFSAIKLIVFASLASEAAATETLHQVPGEAFTEVIALSPEDAACAYAADLLLEKARLGEIEQSPRQVLETFTTELEPLWNRITRPLPARVDTRHPVP